MLSVMKLSVSIWLGATLMLLWPGLGCRKKPEPGNPAQAISNGSKTNALNSSDPEKYSVSEGIADMLSVAQEGDPEAQYYLGVFYVNGGEGVPKDLAEAYKWWKLSANQNYSESVKH